MSTPSRVTRIQLVAKRLLPPVVPKMDKWKMEDKQLFQMYAVNR